MNFDKKYELQLPIPELTGKQDEQISGRQISTGRLVTIHILAGGYSGENQRLLQEAAELPPKYRGCFIEIGDHQGMPFLVADAAMVTVAVREWIPAATANLEISPLGKTGEFGKLGSWKSSDLQRAEPEQPKAGEFTQMMQTVKPVALPAPVEDSGIGEFTRLLQTVPGSVQPTTAPPEARPQPGEFTRLLQAVKPEPVVEPPVIAAPVVAAPIPASTPGEFTRLLQTVNSPEPPPAAVPPAKPAEIVDPLKTRLFTIPAKADKPVPPPIPSALEQIAASKADFPAMPANPAPGAREPGEFTRMMESPLSRGAASQERGKPQPFSSPPVSAPPLSRSPGEFTRMLETPMREDSSMPSSAPAQPSKAPSGSLGEATRAFQMPVAGKGEAPAAPAGPSEFTRMFQTPAKAPEPKDPKPVAKQPRVIPKRKKKKDAFLLWVLILSAVLLIVVVALYFALR